MKLHDVKTTKILNTIIKKVKKTPDAFFDFGPGHLLSEAWGAKEKWPECFIIGLEPHVLRYQNLVSQYPGLLFNEAISNKVGTLSGFMGKNEIRKREASDFTIMDRSKITSGYQKCDMPCVTVDYINKHYGPFKHIFIWADIQQSELLMLHGSIKALKSNSISYIYLELKNKQIKLAKTFLKKYGFTKCLKIYDMDFLFTK